MMDFNSTTLTVVRGRDQIQNLSAGSYVLNGKIMLCSVIILFVVVFVLACFHSYASWLRHRHRHRHRRAHQLYLLSSGANTINTAPPQAHQALDLSVLKRIPVFVYSPNTDDPRELLDCAVCLSEFEDNENGRVLPKCRHTFHVDCIDMWFQSHSNCPLCRTPVQLDTLVHPPAEVEEVVSDIEPAEGDSGVVHQMGCSASSSSSSLPPLASVSVDIPRAQGNLRGLDDMGLGLTNERDGFKSSGNRVLTLKRIWSI